MIVVWLPQLIMRQGNMAYTQRCLHLKLKACVPRGFLARMQMYRQISAEVFKNFLEDILILLSLFLWMKLF